MQPKLHRSFSAEGSPSDGGEACKLFIHGLARTVTDDDLVPLFAPFGPIYTCVAIGKKGGQCMGAMMHPALALGAARPAPT